MFHFGDEDEMGREDPDSPRDRRALNKRQIAFTPETDGVKPKRRAAPDRLLMHDPTERHKPIKGEPDDYVGGLSEEEI